MQFITKLYIHTKVTNEQKYLRVYMSIFNVLDMAQFCYRYQWECPSLLFIDSNLDTPLVPYFLFCVVLHIHKINIYMQIGSATCNELSPEQLMLYVSFHPWNFFLRKKKVITAMFHKPALSNHMHHECKLIVNSELCICRM